MAMSETMRAPTIETYRFADDGIVPNNPALPLVVYRGALPAAGDRASACERMFAEHGLPDSWRNGIYADHHYHSTAHEGLGIARGNARVRLGRPGGQEVELNAGDVVGIPAGNPHQPEGASSDPVGNGAYPRRRARGLCPAHTGAG